jgi:hypothetical protein
MGEDLARKAYWGHFGFGDPPAKEWKKRMKKKTQNIKTLDE